MPLRRDRHTFPAFLDRSKAGLPQILRKEQISFIFRVTGVIDS
jgi:hypothetical protein